MTTVTIRFDVSQASIEMYSIYVGMKRNGNMEAAIEQYVDWKDMVIQEILESVVEGDHDVFVEADTKAHLGIVDEPMDPDQ